MQSQHNLFPTAIYGEHRSGVHGEPGLCFHSNIEETQEYATAHALMFPHNVVHEENRHSLCSVSSTDRNGSTNVPLPMTKCIEDSYETASQVEYAVLESTDGLQGTSVLTRPFQESLIQRIQVPKTMHNIIFSLKRLKPFVIECELQDTCTYNDDMFEESTVQSSTFEAPEMETSQLAFGDNEGFPVQATDQNSPVDSDHIVLPNVFFHPHHKSQEELSMNSTSYACTEISGTIVKPERGSLFRSSRQLSVHRGHPETESDNKSSSYQISNFMPP